jgi:hypothetical protein
MPTSFEYAVIRVVPRVEREEFLNAGVILFSLESRFLKAVVELDEKRLRTLDPAVNLAGLRDHLRAFEKVCEGADDGGPIARLSQRERFRWLVSPRSTMIQVSAVHAGLCESPQEALERLFRRLVTIAPSAAMPPSDKDSE